jgi:hypothetical protein
MSSNELSADDRIKLSKHKNELKKEHYRRVRWVALIALPFWCWCFFLAFIAHDRPEPVAADVKALAVAMHVTPPEQPTESGWLVAEKETRATARLLAVSALTAAIGFIFGEKAKPEV